MAIASSNPDNLWRVAEQQASLMKIGILADDGEALIPRMEPNALIGGVCQADAVHVNRIRKQIG